MKSKISTLALAVFGAMTIVAVTPSFGADVQFGSITYTPNQGFVLPYYYTSPNGATRWVRYTYDDQYVIFTQKNENGSWVNHSRNIIPRADDGSNNCAFTPTDAYLTCKNPSGATNLYIYPNGDTYTRKAMGGWVGIEPIPGT